MFVYNYIETIEKLAYFLRKIQSLWVNNSRILTIKNAKLSGYYFYINLNILGDFQICVSVPLNSSHLENSVVFTLDKINLYTNKRNIFIFILYSKLVTLNVLLNFCDKIQNRKVKSEGNFIQQILGFYCEKMFMCV